MPMKLLDFLQLPIMQLLRKFHLNILTTEGEGDNILGLTLKKSQILKSVKNCTTPYHEQVKLPPPLLPGGNPRVWFRQNFNFPPEMGSFLTQVLYLQR